MSFTLDEKPSTFTVKLKNIKIEYPITTVLIKSCPFWATQIFKEKIIELDDMDLYGVCDFFDGILNKQINFTNDNCQTILKLSELSGSTKIKEQVKIFINNQKPPQDILKELIKENETNKMKKMKEDNIKDQQDKEIYLGKHYNEILKFPELLKNIEISQHHRIVQYAMNNNKDEFNYQQYITFVIELLEKEKDKKYNILLSNIDMKYYDIDQLKRLCKIENFDENVVQHKIINFITKMKEQETEIKKQNELTRKLQTQIDEYQTINKRMIDEIKNILKQQQQNIQEQFKTFANDQRRYQNENKHQNDEIMKGINNQQKSINEIKQQNTQIEKLFKDQQNLVKEIKQENKQIIDEKSTTIISRLKKEIETNHFENEFSKITTTQNNTNNEIKEIQRKISNLPSQFYIEKTIQNAQKDNSEKLDIISKQIDSNSYIKLFEKNFQGEKLSGLLSFLTSNYHKNLNDIGIISITGNRDPSGDHGSLSSLVSYPYYGVSYRSCDDKNSFICFDFKEHCVSLSAYSIKSSNCYSAGSLQSWIIEGSNDEKEWIELDSHTNENTLNISNTIRTFFIHKKKRIKQPLRYIKLRITGPNSINRHYIDITCIEFFGKFY